MKPVIDRVFKSARESGAREPFEAYAFDAMVLMCEGSTEAAPSGPRVDRSAKPSPRFLTVLRADLPALQRGHLQSGEVCEIPGLGPISVAAARAALGDSILKLVITRGVDVLNVTHLGRGANTAQKVALLWMQPECSRLGCHRSMRLEYDHRDEFAKVRCTELRNLDPLCDRDHDLKTLHGWALVNGTGKRPMVSPDDPRHPRNSRPPP